MYYYVVKYDKPLVIFEFDPREDILYKKMTHT